MLQRLRFAIGLPHERDAVFLSIRTETFANCLQNVFPKMLINMVKTAEMTGDLPSILDDMSEYYTSMDQTRKQMKSITWYHSSIHII